MDVIYVKIIYNFSINPYISLLLARKIDEENDALNSEKGKKGKKGKKGGNIEAKKEETDKGIDDVDNNDFEGTKGSRKSIFGNEPVTSKPEGSGLPELPPPEAEVRIGDRMKDTSSVEEEEMNKRLTAATAAIERETELRVPKADPLKQVRFIITVKPQADFSFKRNRLFYCYLNAPLNFNNNHFFSQ